MLSPPDARRTGGIRIDTEPSRRAPLTGGGLPALLRATHPGPSLAVTCFVSVLALSAGRGWGTLWVASAALAGQFSVGWANDWIDSGRDRLAGRRDKPIVAGLVSARRVRRAALLALIASVPLSLASGPRAASVHLLAVGLGWVYDLKLKFTLWSVVPYAGAFALLPVFVILGLPARQTGPWWAALGGGLLGAGAHFTNVLPDLDDDTKTGVRGLPQRLGARPSLLIGATLLGLGVLVVCLAPEGPMGPARTASLIAGLACVAAAVIAGTVGRARLAFPCSMLAAGAVVVAFIDAGSRLA